MLPDCITCCKDYNLFEDINREFISMKSNLATIDSGETKTIHEFIERHLEPNEREKKLFGEVFTPLPLVQEMLGSIEKYADKDFWKNPNLKILDPAAGIGNFPLIAYEKLMEGLKSVKGFKGEEARRKHILEKMLYMVELNPNNVRLMNKIFNGKKYKLNVLCTDFLLETEEDIKKHDGLSSRQKADGKRLLEWNTMKFDLVMGNPPYNKEFDKGGASPLYHEFVEKCIDDCQKLTYVIPSRWFSGGKGLDKFRSMMISRKDLIYIVTKEDASAVFGSNVNIKGGVNYFLKDSSYKGMCLFDGTYVDLSKYDIVTDPSGLPVVAKVLHLPSISELYVGRFFKIETNNARLDKNGNVLCYVSLDKSKDRKAYISYDLKPEQRFWKVITTEAAHKGRSGFGAMFVGSPSTVHTGSYISFRVKTKLEAESLLSYLKTDFANYMLSLRKISQHINSDTCMWIPQVPLDRMWDNSKVYKHFGFIKEDITLITSKMKLA
jgi:site-specific DNA-methyltransferase (adenine-specific)